MEGNGLGLINVGLLSRNLEGLKKNSIVLIQDSYYPER
jgi:hypothetical protein